MASAVGGVVGVGVASFGVLLLLALILRVFFSVVVVVVGGGGDVFRDCSVSMLLWFPGACAQTPFRPDKARPLIRWMQHANCWTDGWMDVRRSLFGRCALWRRGWWATCAAPWRRTSSPTASTSWAGLWST